MQLPRLLVLLLGHRQLPVIESSTGIAEGGRTGLASVVTACLFLSALFFAPLVRMIGGGYVVSETTFYPITAPVLIIVGCLMVRNLVHIN